MSFVITSWNINGLKSCLKKGFIESANSLNAQILCFQEIRTDKVDIDLNNYLQYWNCGTHKGYAGVLTLSKIKPNKVIYGIGNEELDKEGRVITLEFNDFYVVNAYVPNSQTDLERYYFRLEFDEAFNVFISDLKQQKPVIICGDLNVAYEYLDINAENIRNKENPAGFLAEEREGFKQLLSLGLIDTFRYLYPDRRQYTWFCSNKTQERRLDFGSRIDYFLVSKELINFVCDVVIHSDIAGSDHCPLSLVFKTYEN